jgi:hypothetical protein
VLLDAQRGTGWVGQQQELVHVQQSCCWEPSRPRVGPHNAALTAQLMVNSALHPRFTERPLLFLQLSASFWPSSLQHTIPWDCGGQPLRGHPLGSLCRIVSLTDSCDCSYKPALAIDRLNACCDVCCAVHGPCYLVPVLILDVSRLAEIALEPPIESGRASSLWFAALGVYTLGLTIVLQALKVDERRSFRIWPVHVMQHAQLNLATKLWCPHVLTKRLGLATSNSWEHVVIWQ